MARRLPLSAVTSARTTTPLAGYTTLRLGGTANRIVRAETAEDVVEAVRSLDAAGQRLLVLGGGSNLVIADAGFDGTVVALANTGSRIEEGLVTVEAGTPFDEFVAWTVAEGRGGVETLSGIPGLAGATPIQNVGAYGSEIAETLVSVDLYERSSGQVRTVPAAELGLAYRTSLLKNTDRAVVLRVRLRLSADGLSGPIRYAELARALGVEQGQRVPLADARSAVLELRRGKGMVLDPEDHDTWSAGSFFTNPIVSEDQADAVLERSSAESMPRYPAEGGVKLSAAWLIQSAGFGKGHPGPGGRVALSGKHVLALTNRGGASTEDLLVLAREVRDGVLEAFGVRLHNEPVFVGCEL
nr:UDP-N-acetylmuramate dehydrogenase [Sciscionella sp. SE31]